MAIPPTTLTYMEHMHRLEDKAKIIDNIPIEHEKIALILDHTIFYPQGGGQPFDQGSIISGNNRFIVEEVRFKDGIVYHMGKITEGSFNIGDIVKLYVDPERRKRNSKNHTAGHLVDIALRATGISFIPGKGYHFPDSPYVEYEGILDEQERETLKSKLEAELAKLIAESHPIHVELISHDQLAQKAHFVPDYIPKNKPTRAMIVDAFPAIPCGGTHVSNTKEIGKMHIEKIKNKKGNLRISYSVEHV